MLAEPRQRDFQWIKVQLASPEVIRSWSHGEVTKPETINYRSYRPERDGLFCERIFGPTKDWQCQCGKYKGIRYRGVICDRCGVEVTQAKVRRERMGHIELAVPVAHIWYWKVIPSRIGYLLDISVGDLERVLYYEAYIVVDPGDAPVEKKQILTEEEVEELREGGYTFRAEMGAPAIKELLAELDVEDLSAELRARVKVETSAQRKQELLKRLKVVEAFRQSGNRPEWMILEVIPVIPPDLRPLVPLDGGRFASSDLNDLYRRVINRNNRLKKLMKLQAPEVILRNEKRMLQEAVDALLDNGRRGQEVKGEGNRALKSLSDMLRGKEGRFRQNLLGKRVDYSGRAVIVVGPELKLHQCGLPKTMALELFKPFVIHRLVEKGVAQTVKSAKRMIERERPEVWDALEEIIKDHLVLLNRAPTLHRLSIQAFQPVLIEGKAIKIHPLVCAAFNADFDGDQMAVHVPLSFEAQIEASVLMLSSQNILLPANGSPVVVANPQDIALGCYYLTKMKRGGKGSGKKFANPEEAILAHEYGAVDLHSDIWVRVDGEMVETTVGRLLFNEILPKGFGFVNELLNKKRLQEIVSLLYRRYGNQRTAEFLDKLKEIGYKYATLSGLTISMDDVIVPEEKQELIERALKEVEAIHQQYKRGVITDGERYNKVIDVWTHTRTEVTKVLFKRLQEADGGFNPVFMMHDSGARGSEEQVSQLGGMRGLMTKPQRRLTGGEIIETPITASFKEGLSVLEYFLSSHGARKGLADTALKTAEAGYLTRRMVDVAQDVVVTEEDCGTVRGIEVSALKEEDRVVEPLSERILGRVALEDVVDPATGEIIVPAGEEITEEAADKIERAGIETVLIRSVLTCEARHGVCVKCYGRNLATGKMVSIGEAVGIIAAQSIGEPGTQLTLRTFHVGGTASRIAEQEEITVRVPGRLRFQNMRTVVREDGQVVVVGRNGQIEVVDDQGVVRGRYQIPYGAELMVEDGQEVKEGSALYRRDPYNNPILTDHGGVVRFVDILEGKTVKEEFDEVNQARQWVIVDYRDRSLSPRIEILTEDGNRVRNYILPIGARLQVRDGDRVGPGDILAKTPREISKTRDITGGLPRVAELFEARRPKEPAVVSEIDGTVRVGGQVRGAREVTVVGDDGEERKYLIPYGKHLLVHTGDRVRAGEKLSEGAVNPHDILRILGASKVQEYLVNEIQEVYRLQGVCINDKHI
ncbi:MAG: DNA-directed RNA polymerase subunit beta', partial [Candidatus Latescibacterota bacterium]